MSMKTVIANQNVEWDDKKAAINKQKHGISFGTAAMVFADENRVERYDGKHSQDEDRWQVIGMVNDVLFVVYTERTDAARIIMAREASPKERREYFDHSTSYL
ncbi:MAG: BrnT family toxin [Selenomonadaceae bacterium]|nr:BrnT family toxin [Selenomonadaceae bacterium]